MLWMLAGAALSAASQIGAARMAEVQQKSQNAQIEAYNKAVMSQTAKQFGELSLQKTALAAQYTQALSAVGTQGLQLKGQRQAQAAASDTMGNSVDQSLADVDYQVDAAQDALKYNESLSDEQINAQIQSVADSSSSSLRYTTPVNSWTSALGGILGSVGGSLLSSKFGSTSSTGTGTFTG